MNKRYANESVFFLWEWKKRIYKTLKQRIQWRQNNVSCVDLKPLFKLKLSTVWDGYRLAL